MALSLILVAHTCKQIHKSADSTGERQNSAPMIEFAPLKQDGGHWKITATGELTATVIAPGADQVRILGRPVGMEADCLELRSLTTPVDRAKGKFVTGLNLAPDFAGQVWADDLKFETVGQNVLVTDLLKMQATPPEAARPRGVGFEK